MDILSATWITAGATSAMAMWSRIQGLFSRVSSVVITTVELTDSNIVDVVFKHCWTKYHQVQFGQKRYRASHEHVRPLGSTALVGYEIPGAHQTFLDGYRPLFLAHDSSKNSLKITFLRGTFDIEKIIIEAVSATRIDKQVNSGTYFYIKRYFGRGNSFNDSNLPSLASGAMTGDQNSNHRPLGWNKDDIGQPSDKEPFTNLAYPKEVQDLKNVIKHWIVSKDWFKEKGIRWRLGAGLYGKPGTGKSSFVRAVAQEFSLPVLMFDLPSMSNEELVDSWRDAMTRTPAIVLFEDIDRLFDDNKSLKTGGSHKNPLTLDTLLNCINGVEASDGIVVIITANDINRIDPAIGVPDPETGKSTRPGRIDRFVEFKELDDRCRLLVANRILSDVDSEIVARVVKDGDGDTPAQFEERCGSIAIEEYWAKYDSNLGVLA